MKTFKEFVANDNRHPASDSHDVKRKFMELHNKKRDAWEEKQYQALKQHPDVKGFKIDEALKPSLKPQVPGGGQGDMSVQSTSQDKDSSPGSGAVAGGMTPRDKKKKPPNLIDMTPRE